jgi:hypothetical protein
MLLAVLFMMAIMLITALAVAPRFIQQARRDREEEMIHRGTEYMRAIKRYYRKFGRYPANVEQLENTNQVRFLRKRYKDPLVNDGQWKLLHFGDVSALAAAAGIGVQGAAALQASLQTSLQGANSLNQSAGGATSSTGTDQASSTSPQGAQPSTQQQSSFAGGPGAGGAQAGTDAGQFGSGGGAGGTGQSGFSLGPGPGQSSGPGAVQGQGSATQTGSNNTIFGTSGVGGQTFGGGAIVGVASKSKDPTIRVFNKKKTYDEWQFFYSPMLDMQNTLLRGPYNGQTIGSQQIGTPAGQYNQGQPGQQPGAPGVQNQPAPQQNQQLNPGTQYPPDQSQPQPQ